MIYIYKNKTQNGRKNISGHNISKIRKSLSPKASQRALADKMQLQGIELDKMLYKELKQDKDL